MPFDAREWESDGLDDKLGAYKRRLAEKAAANASGWLADCESLCAGPSWCLRAVLPVCVYRCLHRCFVYSERVYMANNPVRAKYFRG